MTEQFANFFATTLNGAINDSTTALTVSSSVGAPSVDFRILIQDGEEDATNRELLQVTAKAGDNWTVVRGIESTTPAAHGDGSYVIHVVTAGGLLQGIYDRVTNVKAVIAVVIDGGDGAIIPGVKADLSINFAANIESWEILADRSGSIVIDIWKDTGGNFPPTNTDSITGSLPPTLTSAERAASSTLTGWTTILDPDDILRFNVDSASTVVRATLLLKVERV